MFLELHRLIVSQVPPARQPSFFVQRVLGLQFEIFLETTRRKTASDIAWHIATIAADPSDQPGKLRLCSKHVL